MFEEELSPEEIVRARRVSLTYSGIICLVIAIGAFYVAGFQFAKTLNGEQGSPEVTAMASISGLVFFTVGIACLVSASLAATIANALSPKADPAKSSVQENPLATGSETRDLSLEQARSLLVSEPLRFRNTYLSQPEIIAWERAGNPDLLGWVSAGMPNFKTWLDQFS